MGEVCGLDDPWSFAASNSLMHTIHRCTWKSLQFFVLIFFHVYVFFSFLFTAMHVKSLAFCVWEWRLNTIQYKRPLHLLLLLSHSGKKCIHQWWSLETWSRSRDASRDPFFEVFVSVSVSKVSGLVSVSVSKDFGLGLELFVSRLCTGYF